MKPGMGAHQVRTSFIGNGTLHLRADGRQRIALGGDQPDVVGVAGTDDPRLHAAPQQHALVGRLAAAARIEGGAVQHDAGLGVDGHDRRRPLAQCGVAQLQALGRHDYLPWLATAAAAASAAAGSRYSPPRTMGRRLWSSR